jgi:predicted alpha/beta-hydrolase family hydrolase
VRRELQIDVQATQVGAIALTPEHARLGYVLAHGAGAGMTHAFLEDIAGELAGRGVATLRYQFPYMQAGSKRPDPPERAHAAVRAACAAARGLWPDLPIVAGGKSFGGRMTSQAQAAAPLEGVRGLCFLGFPLHPAGAESITRAAHLSQVKVPMLFLQGTRDELAELTLLRGVCTQVGARLVLFDDADHSFHVPAKSPAGKLGQRDAFVRAAIGDAIVAWGERLS